MLRIHPIIKGISQRRYLMIANSLRGKKNESPRMQQFRKQLETEEMQILGNTNIKNEEHISNNEENPTKWGDWQHGGRVTDF